MKYWIGIVFGVLLIALFLLTVDARRMLDALASANYWYLPPAVGMYLCSVYFRSLRWAVMLRHLKAVGAFRLYPVVVIGYMANNLLPMRLGELVRSYYVGEREGINKASALVTVLSERILDALTLLFFIAALAPFMSIDRLVQTFGERFGIPWQLLIAAFSLPFVCAFAAMALFAIYPRKTRSAVMWLARPLPSRLHSMIESLTGMLLQGLAPLGSARTVATLFAISIPIWLTEMGVFYIVGFAFGIDQAHSSPWTMAVTMTLVTAVANIGASLPLAPGGIGLFEFISRETLVLGPLASVDRSVAAGHAIVTHAATLLPMIVLGQVFLWTASLSLRRLRQSSEEKAENPI